MYATALDLHTRHASSALVRTVACVLSERCIHFFKPQT